MRYCPTCGTRFSNETGFCPNDGAATLELEEASPQQDPMLGRVIDGRYRVDAVIGEGGMGIVYGATHAVLGKKFAVKVLRGEMAKDADVVQRFMQEAQAATSIGHENIIDISDFGRLPDESVYFVMEYLEGEALTSLIKRGGSIPMRDALKIIRQMASALGAAHDRGIVHRDLKPDNVQLIPRGADQQFVKVLDFGIAKVGGASSKLTKTGMIFGTPHYMSPEQAAGQTVDQRTDIYALGVIMYEMFTGKVPFDADTFMGILSKHMFEPPVPPSERGARTLGALEDVILKALTKKPEDRYQGMGDLIADLDRVAAGGTVDLARAPGISPPGNLADALEPPSRTEMRLGETGTMRVPQNRGLMVAVIAVVLVVLGGVGLAAALFLVGGEEPSEETLAAIEPVVPDAGSGAPVAPPEPPATPTEVGTAAPRAVEIASEPSGAQVVVGGAMVGNTPVTIPAPGGDVTREVEIRLRGHETETFQLTATSPNRFDVVLREERSAHRPPRTGGMSMQGSALMTRPPPVTMTMVVDRPPTMMTISNEVVDPWAD